MTTRRRRHVIAAGLLACAFGVSPAFADDAGWHALDVPGGRATLSLLGMADDRPRATVMIDLIRRFHFPTSEQPAPIVALRDLSSDLRQPKASDSLVLPSPLAEKTWSEVIFERAVPRHRLFIEILNDAHARLLFHGLAGLDGETRRWFEGQPGLLRWLYRQDAAVRSFALFAPSVRIMRGNVVIPGGPDAERRWLSVLDTTVARPETFIRRLFAHNSGRTAGLYFVFTAVDDARREFLIGAALPARSRERRFQRLVSGFARCYPQHSTAYPFAVRSHDAALLLLEIGLTAGGAPAGPAGRRFWQEVLGDIVADGSGSHDDAIDAAWLVESLCGASAENRAAMFATLLAGHRVFTNPPDSNSADTAAALRARRAYPALFMALEYAGVRSARAYAAAARHATRLSRIDDAERSITALRQFQGAVMLTLNAAIAGTLTTGGAAALIESLSALPLDNQQYAGGIADWMTRRWVPAVTPAVSVAAVPPLESLVAAALAGPAQRPLSAVHWEGLDYVVDVPGTSLQRLLDVRRRQGGVSLDDVTALQTIADRLKQPGLSRAAIVALGSALDALAPRLRSLVVAEEYENDRVNIATVMGDTARQLKSGASAGVTADLARAVDFLLAHVLTSWAYAPHLGDGSGALAGGDGSLRHRLGVRLIGRSRAEQRWALAMSPAARGSIAGSILGVQTALANWSLHRLSSTAVPAPPAIDGNDGIPLTLTAALSNAPRLTDADLADLVDAQAKGAAIVSQARTDPDDLEIIASRASLSPWHRAILSWMVREEPDRIAAQFSPAALAHLGGLRADTLASWGSVSLVSGSLRLTMSPPRIPELFAGRSGDGIVGGRSVDLMLRVAVILSELKLPAALAAPVLRFAMRDYLDRVTPAHGADAEAFALQATALTRREVEDYVGAIAAIGPLRPARP